MYVVFDHPCLPRKRCKEKGIFFNHCCCYVVCGGNLIGFGLGFCLDFVGDFFGLVGLFGVLGAFFV